MVLEYHSSDRIEYEKETIPYMQELSRVDLKMLSETQKIVSEQKYRYGKDEHKKGRNQRTAKLLNTNLSVGTKPNGLCPSIPDESKRAESRD